MLEHWNKFEEYTGIELRILKPNYDFTESLFDREIKKHDGTTRMGNGWASPIRRWCTREKLNSIDRYMRSVDDVVSCIGFASDEVDRSKGATVNNKKWLVRFPLIEYGITEDDALRICKQHGFDWGGLYDHYKRVSCWCCPLQSLSDLRALRKNFPDLWERMMLMDKGGDFRYRQSVKDLEDRFAEEDRLGDEFNIRQYNKRIK
jgi:3'-phosphoadenosine 5'-phosphosulfate sulfotransferase (PAPS reductase)/FAD synthetase